MLQIEQLLPQDMPPDVHKQDLSQIELLLTYEVLATV